MFNWISIYQACWLQTGPKKYEDSDESDSAVGNDSASVVSNLSEQNENVDRKKKKKEQAVDSDNEQGEIEEVDQFETKLDTVLDYIQSTKCGSMRLKHWASLKQALATRFSIEYLLERLVISFVILWHWSFS